MPCIAVRSPPAAFHAVTCPEAPRPCYRPYWAAFQSCGLCGFSLRSDANRNTYDARVEDSRGQPARSSLLLENSMRDPVEEMAVTVRLKPEVAAEVRRAASEEGLAITAVVRRAVLRDLARRRTAA
jgi:hypothetical protein